MYEFFLYFSIIVAGGTVGMLLMAVMQCGAQCDDGER